MFGTNYEENINCVKLREETKNKLLKFFRPSNNPQISVENSEESEESEKQWQDSVVNIPKSNNPYKNIFQKLPQTNEIQMKLSKVAPNTPKTTMKKKPKAKSLKFTADEAIHIAKYGNSFLKFCIKLVFRIGTFVTIYGTELIIQILAVTTIAIVLMLKFLDKFLNNRHLENCIGYVETINFSSLKLPHLNMDYIHAYKILRRFFWIKWKFIEFVLLVSKHVFFQVVFGFFFLISWIVYSTFQFFSHVILLPTVDKTINFLKMDADAIANLTKNHISQFFLLLSISSCEIAPFITYVLVSVANLRFTIVKVNLLKSNLIKIYNSVRSLLVTVFGLIKDTANFLRLMLDLQDTLVLIVVLLTNTLSTIGWFIYLYFLVLQYTGYVIGIFMQVLHSATSALSKLQKI